MGCYCNLTSIWCMVSLICAWLTALPHWLTDWLAGSLVTSLLWFTDWLTDWLYAWIDIEIDKWMYTSLTTCIYWWKLIMDGWVNVCIDVCMGKCIGVEMDVWKNRLDDWLIDWLTDWLLVGNNTNYLIAFTEPLTDWVWVIGWLVCSLIGCLMDWTQDNQTPSRM